MTAAVRTGTLLLLLLSMGCSAPLVRNIPLLSPEDPHFEIEHRYSVRSDQFRRSVGHLLGPAAAERSIKLSSAYFVPNEGTIKALLEAARRGVTVEIITPGEHTDSELVESASQALWGELLEHGVKIYVYQPTMFHCKVLVVDDYFSSVGSTNFDNRSFQLNDEVNLNVFDAAFSETQAEIFEADKQRSKLVTYEDWKERPWLQKLSNWFAVVFRREL